MSPTGLIINHGILGVLFITMRTVHQPWHFTSCPAWQVCTDLAEEGDVVQPKIAAACWMKCDIIMATFLTLTCPGCPTGAADECQMVRPPSASVYIPPQIGLVPFIIVTRSGRDAFPRAGRMTWNSDETSESLIHTNVLLVLSLRSLIEIARRGLVQAANEELLKCVRT